MPGVSKVISPSSVTGATVEQNNNNLSITSTGVVVAVNEDTSSHPNSQASAPSASSTGLAFDEEAKLVYGVVISLRNMIKKLSGKYATSRNVMESNQISHFCKGTNSS
jgi:hypothetical protein